MNNSVRVRFAPSPTGGLHLGGMRTVLYNYLFARKYQGTFILRIEDTDQGRQVDGAEDYIMQCLEWCGITPDESPAKEGSFGPYRQSERKATYREYAEKLVKNGHAYYAFDTPGELEKMRNEQRSAENPSPQYDHKVRGLMKNSLSLPADTVAELLNTSTPHVIRIKIPLDRTIVFTDLIHGEIKFESALVDDKVLLKADGMPTYHLAVVVDDFLMQITHAFRGEEWLSSSPVHILLWEYLFGIDNMPQWAHLPLILGPSGKLSKRDGAKYGFPVFAMNWKDPKSGELTEGFREKGFLPEAFINLLAVLGWNDGSEQEIFSLDELIQRFSIDRVHKAGAKFDFEKAKWFNHEWIKKLPAVSLQPGVKNVLQAGGLKIDNEPLLQQVIELVKDRCILLPDFETQAGFFFHSPGTLDTDSVKPKWDEHKKLYFASLANRLGNDNDFTIETIESAFKNLAAEKNIKVGELQMIFRIILVGSKIGPGVFVIANIIGKAETISRINKAILIFEQL